MHNPNNKLGRREFLRFAGCVVMAGEAAHAGFAQARPINAEPASDDFLDACILAGPYNKQRVDGRPEAVIASMDKTGIRRGLMASLLGVDYSAEEGNRHTLEVCRQHPMRLIPCATANPADFSPGQRLGSRLKNEGFKAVAFFPSYQGWPLELANFRTCAQEIAESGLPMIVTLGKIGEPSRLASALSEIQVPIIVRSPGTGGYWLPAEYLSAGLAHPRLMFDMVSLVGLESIEILVAKLGAKRLVFSSNIPFSYPLSHLYMLRYAQISGADRKAIASGNLERLLGLVSPASRTTPSK
jgi:uncharacterized protein